MTKAGIYTLTQIPGPALSSGTPAQLPLIEPFLWAFLSAAFAVLLWQEPGGERVGSRWAQRLAGRIAAARRHPKLTEALLAWAVLTLVYLSWIGAWGLVRVTDTGGFIARPWPYQSKVYDPQNHYKQAGEPGPFYKNVASTQ